MSVFFYHLKSVTNVYLYLLFHCLNYTYRLGCYLPTQASDATMVRGILFFHGEAWIW